MPIPTEPIGSIPRPRALVNATGKLINGKLSRERMNALYNEALQDTIQRFEQTGSPVITDGEQTKPSFATYPLHGANNLASDGVVIPFKDAHTRRLPRLTSGPFSYQTHAESYIKAARKLTPLSSKLQSLNESGRNRCSGRPRQPWRYARARTPVNGIIRGKCPAITPVRSPITSAASAFSIPTASHQGAAGS